MSDDKIPSFHTENKHDNDMYRFAVRKGPQRYFVLYGDHVDSIAREFMHTTTVVKQIPQPQGKSCPYLIISEKVFMSMGMKLLRSKGRKVEIYENAGGEWKLACQASPGRLEGYEEFFGGQGTQDSSCIASVQCKVSQTGICTLSCAYINQTLRILGYAEFADVSTNFSNLESFLLQIGAKEAIIPVENPSKLKENDVKIRDVLKGADVHLEFQKPKTFKADELPEKLRFLVREGGNLQEVVEMKECSEALAAAVTYLSLAADSCNEQQFTLVHEDLTKFMKLDLAAVRALNMFDDEMDMAHRNKGSLLSFLDECHSPMGKRQLKMWLTQPLLDLVQIKRRQDLVQVFMDDAMLRDALTRSVLTKVPDLDKILKKVQRQRATLTDCMKIGEFTSLIPKAILLLSAYEGDYKDHISMYLEMLNEKNDVFGQLGELVEESLEVDEHDREVRIRASFDDDLQEIAESRNDVRKQINQEFKRVLQSVSQTDKEIKLEYSAQHHHHFRATKKGMSAVEKKKEMLVIESRKDGLKFETGAMRRINAEWVTLSKKYEDRQAELSTMFKDTFASYIEPLDEVAAIISELDILVSFATVSTNPSVKQYVRPNVMPAADPSKGKARILKIVGGRHPLVEHQLMLRGGGGFQKNDLELGSEGTLMMLLTGPNMGGKSTYIRTVGVCVLLAQIGMCVPCDAMDLTLCDAMLARLGAADYVSRGVSTFMAEMMETNAILSSATSNSLVIIDELGRGTSTHDGYGLAWGIAEHLVNTVKCTTLFATHFHELTVMEKELKGVANFHVAADTSGDELKMLYQIERGPCSKSYGINVAQITRFPEPVIIAAKRKSEMLESSSSKRRRTESDGNVDAFVKDWLTRFSATPQTPESAEALSALTAEFDKKAEEFPMLKSMLTS